MFVFLFLFGYGLFLGSRLFLGRGYLLGKDSAHLLKRLKSLVRLALGDDCGQCVADLVDGAKRLDGGEIEVVVKGVHAHITSLVADCIEDVALLHTVLTRIFASIKVQDRYRRLLAALAYALGEEKVFDLEYGVLLLEQIDFVFGGEVLFGVRNFLGKGRDLGRKD